jgi:4-amino-4-deoxy-L-arabinose transferase-like glycosyltransferase
MNRVLRITGILWFVVISARYLAAILKSLRNPFNPGSDFTWMGFALAFVAITATALVWRRDQAMRVGFAVVATTAVSIILLSGALVSALIALWVLAAAVVLGDLTLVKFGLKARDNLCDRFVIAFPLGIAAFGTTALALALVGLFTATVMWFLLLTATAAVSRHAIHIARDLQGRTPVRDAFLAAIPESPFLLLLMGFAAVRNLTWSVAPEVEFDALNVRLAVPQILLEEGRFVDLSYIWHSYFVHLLEYFHAIGLALHGDGVAKLAAAVIGIAAAVSVYSLGRLVFSPTVGLWAAAFFYTTPLVSWGANTAYNDNAVAEFVTATAVAFLLWYRSHERAWIIAAGLLAGAAIAIKPNAAYAVIPLGLALLAVVAFRKRPIQTIASFTSLTCLMALPWYLLVWALTGNPVFPFMNAVFKSPFWEFTNVLSNAAEFGVGTAPGALLRLPFRLTWDTTRFGEALPRGSLGTLLLLVPFGFLKLRANRETRILTLMTLVFLALWASNFQYGRYYTAVLPAIAVLAVGGVLFAAPGFLERSRRIVLAALLVGQIVLLPVLYWRIPERFPVRLALGLESPESLLRRGLEGYAASQYVNGVAQPGERVLSIGHEDLRFYLEPPLETLVESRLGSGLRRAIDLGPKEELAKALSKEKIRYLLLSTRDLENPPSYYPFAHARFLEEFATLEYSDATTRVFHLKQ